VVGVPDSAKATPATHPVTSADTTTAAQVIRSPGGAVAVGGGWHAGGVA
jgi:hypothetical protein